MFFVYKQIYFEGTEVAKKNVMVTATNRRVLSPLHPFLFPAILYITIAYRVSRVDGSSKTFKIRKMMKSSAYPEDGLLALKEAQGELAFGCPQQDYQC